MHGQFRELQIVINISYNNRLIYIANLIHITNDLSFLNFKQNESFTFKLGMGRQIR